MLTHCTLTGVDEQTDLSLIAALSSTYPKAEWGFLYLPWQQGKPGRYPSIAFIRGALRQLPAHVRVALHICGGGIQQLIDREPAVSELVQLIGQRGGRVQLNFNAHAIGSSFTLDQVGRCIESHCGVEFITQYNEANRHVHKVFGSLANHSILFDSSCGNGIAPTSWENPIEGNTCGYVGGLGQTNIACELKKIRNASAGQPFWIGLEKHLRTDDDRFDLDAAQAVLQAVEIACHRPKVYPVIHFLDRATAFAEAAKAIQANADGIFLISHKGDDDELLTVACAIRDQHPTLPVGVNFLTKDGLESTILARRANLPMVWGDDVGVDSKGFTDLGLSVRAQKCVSRDKLDVFASVAFKYRSFEPNPELAAKNALSAGFIPTTSGSGTGSAPDLSKIVAMSKATGGVLAVASGMTPENIGSFAPYLSHILVATGVSLDEHRMDVEQLRLLIKNSRIAASRI